jgi:hypothetical protein
VRFLLSQDQMEINSGPRSEQQDSGSMCSSVSNMSHRFQQISVLQETSFQERLLVLAEFMLTMKAGANARF